MILGDVKIKFKECALLLRNALEFHLRDRDSKEKCSIALDFEAYDCVDFEVARIPQQIEFVCRTLLEGMRGAFERQQGVWQRTREKNQ